MFIASLRSILALKPPFTHSFAAPLPENSPRRMSDLPTTAAVIAPIPTMMGVVMANFDKKSQNTEALGHCGELFP